MNTEITTEKCLFHFSVNARSTLRVLRASVVNPSQERN
ncbi:hypothetical protein GETHLI_35100 [Geothrix limicola]|uniref:Uncharacterized protein n=1 Tax=Geothrix limicola TaxID=2927978 RepID=A0ABQ5QJD9_9BACT|nr:hypothetical protein GETHLI_35100 [Geothrix limicola]